MSWSNPVQLQAPISNQSYPASVATSSITFPANSWGLIAIGYEYNNTTVTPPTVTDDSGGGAWTVFSGQCGASTYPTAAWAVKWFATETTCIVTVAATGMQACAIWPGYALGGDSNSIDVNGTSGYQNASTTPALTTPAVTANDELVLAVTMVAAQPFTTYPDTDFTQLANVALTTRGHAFGAEYRILSGGSGNTVAIAGSAVGTSVRWVVTAVTLKPSSGPAAQQLRPDADTDADSWSTTPLWSKVDEASAGGDVITATAS